MYVLCNLETKGKNMKVRPFDTDLNCNQHKMTGLLFHFQFNAAVCDRSFGLTLRRALNLPIIQVLNVQFFYSLQIRFIDLLNFVNLFYAI